MHKNFSEYFLKNKDKLIAIIETSTSQPVDKLLAVTIFLDEEANQILDCLFLSNGKVTGININANSCEETEEN